MFIFNLEVCDILKFILYKLIGLENSCPGVWHMPIRSEVKRLKSNDRKFLGNLGLMSFCFKNA